MHHRDAGEGMCLRCQEQPTRRPWVGDVGAGEELQGDLCTHGRVDEEEDGRGELEGAQWAMSSRALRSD